MRQFEPPTYPRKGVLPEPDMPTLVRLDRRALLWLLAEARWHAETLADYEGKAVWFPWDGFDVR